MDPHDPASYLDTVLQQAREVLRAGWLTPEQRLNWLTALQLEVVPVRELPMWFLEPRNLARSDIGVDLVSLNGSTAVLCGHRENSSFGLEDVGHFDGIAIHFYGAKEFILSLTPNSVLTTDAAAYVERAGIQRAVLEAGDLEDPGPQAPGRTESSDGQLPPLRPYQLACLEACAKGARVIEMACGTGKTRVMQELARLAEGKVLIIVPSRLLLKQHSALFPDYCLVGTGRRQRIDSSASGYIAMSKSVRLLSGMSFSDIYVDEAHNPLPKDCPAAENTYYFSATQQQTSDFVYPMARAVEDGFLVDYDLIVPIVTSGRELTELSAMLLDGAGHYRRVLAYCSSVSEARKLRRTASESGLAAWHINAGTPARERQRVLQEFEGELQRPVHVLVTVDILAEGVDVESADTCLFVQPRSGAVKIFEAVGRVLCPHPAKPLAHVVLPGVTLGCAAPGEGSLPAEEASQDAEPSATRDADVLQGRGPESGGFPTTDVLPRSADLHQTVKDLMLGDPRLAASDLNARVHVVDIRDDVEQLEQEEALATERIREIFSRLGQQALEEDGDTGGLREGPAGQAESTI